MHLSKPRPEAVGEPELILPSLLPCCFLLLDIYLTVRQERQCKSNPLPINYLFPCAFSFPHLSSLIATVTPFLLVTHSVRAPQHAASHRSINLAVRGEVAMWQTCHCNRQLDKCRGVAERGGPHTRPASISLSKKRKAIGDEDQAEGGGGR